MVSRYTTKQQSCTNTKKATSLPHRKASATLLLLQSEKEASARLAGVKRASNAADNSQQHAA
jgi:hypothetical protein